MADSPAPSTRERLIEAAVEALREMTVADLVTAIGTRAIARRAGVSPASFFHHFPSVTDFAAALLARIYDPGHFGTPELAADLQYSSTPMPADFARQFHLNDFHRLTNDPEFRLRMGLWALGGGQADVAFRDFLDDIDAEFSGNAVAAWDLWGRELRPPIDARTFMALHVAILNGATVRALIDPGRITPEHFARAAATLSLILVRIKGDKHTIDDRLAEANYFPLRDGRAAEPLTDRRSLTRARVLVSAAQLFGAQGYEDTSLAQITRDAQVSESTLFGLFESKHRLALALWNKQLGDLIAVQSRTDPDPEPATALRTHLHRLATFTRHHPELAVQYLTYLVCHEPVDVRDGEDAALTSTVKAVGEAVQAGTLRAELDVEHAAQVIVSTLLSRVVAAPSADAESAVDAVHALILDGLRP